MFRTILADAQIHDINFHGIGPISANGNVEAAHAGSSQEAAPRASDEGTFLSNLLHQIMPIVSQNATATNNSSVEGVDVIEDRTMQVSSVQVSFPQHWRIQM